MLLLLALVVSSGAGAECSWCQAGGCNASGHSTLERLAIPTTKLQIHYWRPTEQQTRLGEPNAEARLGVVVLHGAARNGHDYTRYVVNALDSSSLVFGLQFFAADAPEVRTAEDAWWDQGWPWGGDAANAQVSSFDVVDAFLDTLADHTLYPSIERIVFTGHSAGGQLVQRYALWTKRPVDERFAFFAANPSSFVYLSPARPVTRDLCCRNDTIKNTTDWTFRVPTVECAYDAYGYGLSTGPFPPYVARSHVSTEAALAAYGRRAVAYVAGESDVCNSHHPPFGPLDCIQDDAGLDDSCEAMAQGPCRMARTYAFANFVRDYYGNESSHTLVSVPGAGHNGCAIFQSAAFAQAAFPPALLRPSSPSQALPTASRTYHFSPPLLRPHAHRPS